MIRIGNQTSKTASPLTLPFEYALERRFDAFEWFPDKDGSGTGWEEKDLDARTREWIRECGMREGIRFSVHAPLWANSFRSGAITAFGASLNLFEDIGASLFNIHFPLEPDLHDCLEAIKPLILHIQAKRGQLAIENVPSTSPEDVNRLFALLKNAELPIPYVGLCLDLGHANLHDATRNDYLRYLRGIHECVPIIHVHAHENHGDQDSHLPIFSGPAAHDESGIREFVQWLKRRNFGGSIILEQWPDPPDLLDRARGRLREMLILSDVTAKL
jgi:sugar phosphate isomerase/epimerase